MGILKRMLSQRYVSILSLSCLSLLVLFHFQNCAPAKPTSDNSSQQSGADARLIEDFNKVEIQFATPEVQLQDAVPAADVSGLCNRSHNGAKLKWTIWASAGTPLLKGEAVCGSGQFNLNIAGLDQMVCGVGHQLVVEGDWGGSAFTHLLRRCEPLASEPAPQGMQQSQPPGTSCALEYVPSDDAQQSPCSMACYRQGQLMSQVFVAREQCADLAARLAGP